MEKPRISWKIIESALARLGKDQVWLGDRLGIGKNAVNNWKGRDNGAPAAYAPKLAPLLGISIGELLGSDDLIDVPKRHDKQPLSDEAQELISCVVRLDALGEIPRQMFVHHKGLLLLSVASAELQDLLTGRGRLGKIDQLLAPHVDTSEGQPHAPSAAKKRR